ncbi:MAG: hypothetical protein EOS73_26250 [Mesorhizobium sp.]|uniref:hypothetical protein n=1 Tax=Mesorhizobium sp. M7A.F.Ca.ET.027.02.1.1 TaxID=2496655 RepID=UPI000FD2EA8A|nr:hypothetical protein [Mesorhizobium sp. M7A.F.Ca.ET.027.02.1.1]RVD13390.1 hypothetical protein EN749_23720 [Mesorhizobium sp. M7A.F.Ca.ET.027.02.1.1]RWC99948.1 MAG: hypothetical protein EOS73_26250 [Mesorhizobium sp.]
MTWLITIIAGLVGIPRPLAGIIAWVAIALAISGTVWGGYELVKHWGAQEVRDQIEKDNQDAIRKGIEASRSFDDCIAARGVWDFRRQRCSSATLGPR